MPTVFVTGATGRIGKHVVPKLLERGYRVRAGTNRSVPVDWTNEVDVIPLYFPASAGLQEALEGVATAYLAFAFARPAIYEAMFVLPSGLHFAEADAPPELHEAFGALAAVIAPFCNDVEVATEAFWAALHGLAELERDGRIRPAFRGHRINLVVQTVSDSRPATLKPR